MFSGQFMFESYQHQRSLEKLVSARYIDQTGQATIHYPENPNGSVDG